MGDSQTYLKSLTPYIPRTILDWYQQATADEIHAVSEHEGCVVCIDASGFTALTKQLSSQGKEGPETLTTVLNLFFEAVSGVIFRRRGDVLKFAGDALWAFFPEFPDAGGFFNDILEAVKSVNASDQLKGRTQLSVHAGAECGRFYLASLGEPGRRLEAEPIGNLLGTVYAACDAAGENEFAVGPALARKCSETEQAIPIDAKFSLVRPNPAGDKPTETPDEGNEMPTPGNFDLLRPYLPQDVLTKIETSLPSMSVQGEHRHVVVLFANFENNIGRKTDDPFKAIKGLNQKLKDGFESIRQFHGSIARIDPFKRGHKLLVLFGAPTKREDDEINALLCARRLLELSDDSFRVRIGLAIGPLFCGDVGAEKRREYTVMGDGINMAARLMAKAEWEEIIIDPSLRNKLPNEVMTEPVDFELKGIGDKITCHRFTGVSDDTSAGEESSVTIGQEALLDELSCRWKNVVDGQSQMMVVTGPTGSGKTTLLAGFVRSRSDVNRVGLACKNSRLFGRGWLARKLLQKLLITNGLTTGLEEFIRSRIDSRWLPLFADILGDNIDENRWTRGLTPALRTEKAGELFAGMVGSIINSPHLVILDDFEMSDDLFRGLILSLATWNEDTPLMLVLITREVESLQMADNSLSVWQELSVNAPSDDDWWKYFNESFENGKRETELFERILSTSKGNPHFIMQFLSQCAAERNLIKNEISGKWELAASGLNITVPDGLANLHLSIFDNLPEVERTIMKAASVAVGDFSAELIHYAIPQLDQDTIKGRLDGLAQSGTLQYRSRSNRYNYVHTSMREAVYQCVPKSQLRDLHHRFADKVEQKDEGEHLTLLAYHFYRASIKDKGFRYSLEAARESFKRHALTESAEFFNQCLNILIEFGEQNLDVRQRLTYYNEYSEFLALEGRVGEAYPVLRKWRKLAKEHNLVKEGLLAAIQTANLLFKQSRYPRSRKVLGRVLVLASKYREKEAEARALAVLSQVERRTGEFARAQESGERAVEIAQEMNDTSTLADARNRLALVYWGAGKLDDAAATYQYVIENEKDDNIRLANAYNNLGIIQQERGNFVDAESLVTKALELSSMVGERRRQAYAFGNLGNLYQIFGRLVKAEEVFLQADLIFERLNDRHAHYYSVGNLGDIDLMRGDMKSAEARFQQVMDFAREVEDKELVAECEVRFGELSFFRGEIGLARTKYQQAIEIAEEIGSHEYLTRALVGLARLLIGQRGHLEALEIIKRVSELSEANKAILSENEAVFLEGEQYRIREQQDKAISCYRKTLSYARAQNLFELILKSAVRLYELDESSIGESSATLKDLHQYFVEHNGLPAWDQLVNSAYFSYFSSTLREVIADQQLMASPTVLE